MHLWQYQAQLRWSDTNGLLTDQSRLWLNALFRTVTTAGEGPVQLGGDIGGTSAKPIVEGLQGKAVASTLPANGQVLTWSSTNNDWEPGTAAAAPVAVREVPSGTLNSVNQAFSLSFTPSSTASLSLFVNGVEQTPNGDYTLAGATINFAVAPKATDWLLAFYTH
jgi:hypothetical protein